MEKRLKLHEKLVEAGEPHIPRTQVYFQPPSSLGLKYPCIIYHRSKVINKRSNDSLYDVRTAYEITVVDQDPDSLLLQNIMELAYCEWNDHYVADNLNHDLFTIYI